MAGFENNVVYGAGFKLQTSSARDISDMQRTASDVSNINYVGDPEGVISANPSSLCHDPVSGILYRKNSGTGNTGWVVVGAASASTMFSLAMTTDQTVPEGSFQNISYDTVLIDTASAWGAPFYVVPTTGNWLLNVNCTAISTAGFTALGVYMGLDPTNFKWIGSANPTVGSPLSATANGSILVPLTQGDLLKVAVFGTTSGSTDITIAGLQASTPANTFSGILIV
jgi:hypothetical protein